MTDGTGIIQPNVRAILGALASLASVTAFMVACTATGTGDAHAARSSQAPSTEGARTAPAVAPLDYVERCVASSCDASLPLLVVIHGLGDSPEAFVSLYESLAAPFRVVALRAPISWNDGYAWFPYRARSSTPESIAEALHGLVPRVLTTIDAICALRRCDGRVFASGFSQGGMMSYALAAEAPSRFVAVFPVSGMLPRAMTLASTTSRPRVLAFHGDTDRVVELSLDQAGVTRLEAGGYDVTLSIAAGVGHTIPLTMRAALLAEITRAVSN